MTLTFVPYGELERIRALDGDPVERAAAFADACRINVLHMVQRRGLGPPRIELQLHRHARLAAPRGARRRGPLTLLVQGARRARAVLRC